MAGIEGERVDPSLPSVFMGISKRLEEHLAVLLAAAGSMFVAVRLWVVAHFDTTTALGILAEQGTATVVGGTIIYLLSFLPFLIANGLITASIESPEKRRVYLWLSAAAVVLGSLFWPWPFALINSLVWAFFSGRPHGGERPGTRMMWKLDV